MGGAAFPVLLMVAFAIAMSIAMLVAGRLLGPSRRGAVKQMPYESGMDPIHDARRRFDVRFYMVAIAFLIFDVELLFLYPWAVSRTNPEGLRRSIQMETGPADMASFVSSSAEDVSAQIAERTWIVFGGVMVFLLILILGYVYDWKKGLFQWR